MRGATGFAIGVLWMALMGAPGASATLVEAPGFAAGPRITPAGLMWLGASGPMLGRSRVSQTGAKGFPLTASSSRWVVIDSRRGIQAKRLGSSWRGLAALSRCPPLATGPPSFAPERLGLTALTGDQLFAVRDPRCLHRRGYGRAAIVAESLSSGSWKLLAPAPTGALALSASGERLVIAAAVRDRTNKLERLIVTVYDARTGRHLYRVIGDLSEGPPYGGDSLLSLTVSVDSLGDVLVTESEHRGPVASGPRSSGWWATPRSPHEHQLARPITTAAAGLSGVFTQRETAPTADVALSAGRIAYATGGGRSWRGRIELLDLRTRRARMIARFPGQAGVLGLDLSPGELAWAQQSSLPEGFRDIAPNGASRFTCNVVALGEPQLVSIDPSSIPAAGLTVGLPLPAANTPPCTDVIG